MKRGQDLSYYEGVIDTINAIFDTPHMTEGLRLHLLSEINVTQEELGQHRLAFDKVVARFEAVKP